MPVFAAELFVGVGYALPVIKSSSSIYSQGGTLSGRNKIKHSGLNVTGGAIFARKHRLSITLQDIAKNIKYAEVLNVEGEVVALSYDFLLNFGLFLGASVYQSKLKSGNGIERDFVSFADSFRVGYMLKITEESAFSLLLTSYGGEIYNDDDYHLVEAHTNIVLLSIVYTYTFGRRVLKTD